MSRRFSGHLHVVRNGPNPTGRRANRWPCKTALSTPFYALICRGSRFADFTRRSGVCIHLSNLLRSPLSSLPGPAAQLKIRSFRDDPRLVLGQRTDRPRRRTRVWASRRPKYFRSFSTKSPNLPTGITTNQPSAGRIVTLVCLPSGCRFARPVLPHGAVPPLAA